ncbi:MAG: dehydrogenase [SAR116 cluster bacterium]|nr:dehydrogenase [SAR116 cluster bacterium]RPH09144.1 MAG: gfo/Idh/MocA family oxidoreductase [Alphaproteobacteria bacterium TMED54]|tara:strand:- start:501 stop:1517 length:1017 start_codon:yes stop_codon:yes gene_type:complete
MERIVVIGTGYFSQFHFDAWKRLGVDLVGICSLNQSEARRYSKKFKNCKCFSNIENMIKETQPTIIDIVIPPKNQLEIIKKILKFNVNIICQKPFTNSLKEAKQIFNRINNSNNNLYVHENFRFQPWHLKIKKMLEKKIIGIPYQIFFKMRPGDGQGKDAYLNRQPYFQIMNKFLIHETGVHFIDIFRFFFGEIKSVYSKLKKLNSYINGEDQGIIIFEFKNNVLGLFDGNRLSDHIAKDRRLTIGEMFIEGSQGTIRLNGDGDIFFRKFKSNREINVKYKWEKRGFAGDSVYKFQKHILSKIKNKQDDPCELSSYLKNLEIEKAIYKSNELKKTIFI